MAHEKSVRTCAENAVGKLFHDPRNVEEFLALVGASESERRGKNWVAGQRV